MKKFHTKDRVDQVFEISLVLKVAYGVLELLGGGLLFFVKPETIHHFIVWLTQQELQGDPHDLVANHLLKSTTYLTQGSVLFVAIYLASHGIAKIALVVGIWLEQLWAYLGLIAFTAGFIIYQLYRLAHTHSLGLALLTLLDFAIVYLTTIEYNKKRKAWAKHPPSPPQPQTNSAQ